MLSTQTITVVKSAIERLSPSSLFSLSTLTPLRAEDWVPWSLHLLVTDSTVWDQMAPGRGKRDHSHTSTHVLWALHVPSHNPAWFKTLGANKALSSLRWAAGKLVDWCTKECLIMLSRYPVLAEPLWHSAWKKWQPSIVVHDGGLASGWPPAPRAHALPGSDGMQGSGALRASC